MKNNSVGRKLFVSVLGIFIVFAACFIMFQQSREKQYRRESLNSHLQEYNFRIYEAMRQDTSAKCAAKRILTAFPEHDLRLTLIKDNGTVIFDNKEDGVLAMANHLNRPEISSAMSHGSGNDYDRLSSTLQRKYFYSATHFPADSLIVRTALPYDADLANSLREDQHYIWFALGILVLLTLVLWRFLSRLAENISKLQMFARRADHNEVLTDDEIEAFPNDELGDIARRIVKIYKKLKETQEQQTLLKRQLTQNIAHELKTPVASIHGYLETLIDNPNIDNATRQQFMNRCYAQTNRLTSLLQDISTLNRLDDAAVANSAIEAVDISKTMANIVKETALQVAEKEMTIKNRLPQNIIIDGNQSLLYSIFRNLTDNAIAYAGKGATISVSARETQSFWFFEFADNGIGVADCHLPRLFERFYRVDKGRSRAMGGTGLGLAIVKNAVQFHGGTISVTNRKGGGLLFQFSLRKNMARQSGSAS